ncbi:glycosyltransferase [Vagococcus carniphilus]|uniref:glycosyltransferase n=1 Tax=Vagococcus carniphilus TaxID=218144 RepID=UPI00288C90B5|nr:glycosyltransferase [Vagococcus carniphilus]MDT2848677.1 glycosyltransferase [Vagococcus carniphilus]
MNILFCHDGPLVYKTTTKTYYGIAHNDKILSRYLDLGSNLSVLIRVREPREYENLEMMSPITLPNTEIINVSDVFKKPQSVIERNKLIERAVKKSDKIVVRLPSMIGLTVIKYCKKYDKNYLVEFVADPWDSLWNHSLKGKIVAPFISLLNKKAVKDSLNVVYVTENYLQKRYPTNGISFACSDVDLESKEIKISEMKKNSKEKFGTLAAVDVRFKGQDCVIKALGYLKKNNLPLFDYQLVGGGDTAYLKKLAQKYDVEECVSFLGPLKHEDVFEWLSSLDGYIQPSKQEGLPRALLEAMSCGLFCIGAKTGGIPELIESEYIFSNKKKNYIEIAKLINNISVDEMNKQGLRNFTESKKYFKYQLNEKRKGFYKEVFKIY